ncbi:MAG: DUF362 domain-containing protein [Ignavibacteria bacterium]|jgi:hypothetical protein
MNKLLKKFLKSWYFYFLGISSLVWFLIRVIPKPSRAAYPCMRTAAPIASSFVLYLLGMTASLSFFSKAKKFFIQSKYILFAVTLLISISLGVISMVEVDGKVYALAEPTSIIPNAPVGTGKGVLPGRVVWVHNPDATNENCTNQSQDYWCDDKNTDQEIVNTMVSNALQTLTNTSTDGDAWGAIFRYHNSNHDKGNVGYTSGEKVVIKINFNSNGCGYYSNNYQRYDLEDVDTSPQICLTILDQLVNVVGVVQEDISIGDPGKNFDDLYYDKCSAVFPDVHYWGKGNGRTPVVASEEKVIFMSDGSSDDWLPQSYVDAEYMINIPVFKKHHRAGISLAAKNHFGSFVPFHGSAAGWHPSLPASEGGGDVNNGDYGSYRCFVDIMGHKHLGDKTILYLVDGLWSSTNWAHPPIKWSMPPFNDDYPSSIFASMDPVALESVGYDFLYNEFGPDHPTEGDYDPTDNKGPFPHYAGVDDYLQQAADPSNWAEGITYDPENDGIPLESLGANEHWNNAVDKQYSRNLGLETGIELVYFGSVTDVSGEDNVIIDDFKLNQNYPNPFNPSTTIEYQLAKSTFVNLSIYNVNGQLVKALVKENQAPGNYSVSWDGKLSNGKTAASGVYFYKITTENFVKTNKMVMSK